MKFGEDWRGAFIRGDNAAYFALHLEALLNHLAGTKVFDVQRARGVLAALHTLLRNTDESRASPDVQRLRPFVECKADPPA
jgi:hypothetical protein